MYVEWESVRACVFTLRLILLRVCFVYASMFHVYFVYLYTHDKTWHRFILIFDTFYVYVVCVYV